ncbi:MAG: hypothetical protein Q9228_005251 [Teloschistes exilis]
MLAIILALSVSLHVSAQTLILSSTNQSSPGGPEFELATSDHSFTLNPLTDSSSINKITLAGVMTITDPSNARSLPASAIAYICCDDNAYPGPLKAEQTLIGAIGRDPKPVAILLYSLNSTRCTLSPNDYPSSSMYSMTKSDDAHAVLMRLTSNVTGNANWTISSKSQGSGNGGGGILGKSPTTAVAMIILYSITGLITALFLCIIIVGAIRAHRHPERYGPRNIIGRPRQSRAKGLARAMLETLPIVKFGDNDNIKPTIIERDIEMVPSNAVPEAPVQEHSYHAPTAPTDHAEASEASTDAPGTSKPADNATNPLPTADPMVNADNGLACSVCTDDFAKGQDVRVLPCNHKFHPECIDPWLLNVSGTCPLCRVDLRPANSNEDPDAPSDLSSQPRRHSEALTSFAATPPNQSRRSSRARPLHYLHHYLNRGRMEEATPQERLEALRRLRLVNHEDVDLAASADQREIAYAGGESSTTDRGLRVGCHLRHHRYLRLENALLKVTLKEGGVALQSLRSEAGRVSGGFGAILPWLRHLSELAGALGLGTHSTALIGCGATRGANECNEGMSVLCTNHWLKMSKLLSVFGATGQQGGSLLRGLLKRPDVLKIYRLRGITRDLDKASAIALRDAGVEMVQGDMDDESSLKTALDGSYAVFAITNFWEKASAEVEINQGKAMADAAVAVGAKLIIWSSLPDVTAMSGGKFTSVKHFDSKAKVESYIRDLPITSAFYWPGFFMQMTTNMFKPKLNDEGKLTFSWSWGNTPTPMIDVTDTAKYLIPILLDPNRYSGKRFVASTAYYSATEIVEAFKKITGKDMQFIQAGQGSTGLELPPEIAKVLEESSGLMADFKYYGPTGPKDLEWTLAQMDDPPTTFEDFVKANEPWGF